jgi:hypothetical protein
MALDALKFTVRHERMRETHNIAPIALVRSSCPRKALGSRSRDSGGSLLFLRPSLLLLSRCTQIGSSALSVQAARLDTTQVVVPQ